MFPLNRFGAALLAPLVSLSLLSSPVHAAEATVGASPDDDTFMLLREAARRDDGPKASVYAARLANHDIPSYVDYYRLKPRLKEAAPAEVREFFKRYEGMAIADRLRNDWLLELGARRDWTN